MAKTRLEKIESIKEEITAPKPNQAATASAEGAGQERQDAPPM